MASTVRRPSRIPETPALRILLKFIPAPRAKPLKGGRRIMPVARIFLHSWSRLPIMNPITMGMMLAMMSVIGKLPMPEAPNAIMVKKGPSLRARMEVAPTSVSSPNSPARVA